LKFNQSKKRKPISSLMNFTLIGQNPIQSQYQSLSQYQSDTGFSKRFALIGLYI